MTDRQLSENDGSTIRVPVWIFVAVAGNKSCFFCHDEKHLIGGLLLAILALVVIIFIKSKNSMNITKVETNEVYGTYDLTGEMSDYNTVEDTNDYYGR